MSRPVRVSAVEPLEGHHVRLEFTNGTQKEVDLDPFLRGPVFEEIRSDLGVFRTVHVDERAGTIVWDNGADIDPDVLYEGLKPAWTEPEGETARMPSSGR